MDCYIAIEDAIKELSKAGFEVIKETEYVFIATNPTLDTVIYFSADYCRRKINSIETADKCMIKRSLSSRPLTSMIDIHTAIKHATAA